MSALSCCGSVSVIVPRWMLPSGLVPATPKLKPLPARYSSQVGAAMKRSRLTLFRATKATPPFGSITAPWLTVTESSLLVSRIMSALSWPAAPTRSVDCAVSATTVSMAPAVWLLAVVARKTSKPCEVSSKPSRSLRLRSPACVTASRRLIATCRPAMPLAASSVSRSATRLTSCLPTAWTMRPALEISSMSPAELSWVASSPFADSGVAARSLR